MFITENTDIYIRMDFDMTINIVESSAYIGSVACRLQKRSCGSAVYTQ